jgi:hypothetical protein
MRTAVNKSSKLCKKRVVKTFKIQLQVNYTVSINRRRDLKTLASKVCARN